MTAQAATEPPRCCFFNITTATVALGIFHMVMSVLLLIEYSLEVASGKGFCKDLDKDYYRIVGMNTAQPFYFQKQAGKRYSKAIQKVQFDFKTQMEELENNLGRADVITSFLLILMLFVISFNLLLGVVKRRERLLIPFLALQVLDFFLSLLTMFSSYIQVPATISVSSLHHTQGHSKIPFLALQLLDFCLSILTLCSSYMEVPTYLSLKSSDNGGFLPTLEKLPTEEYAKVMITFTIAFVAVLFLKAYMFKCVLSCFKFIKASKREEVKVDPQAVEKAVLPSYDEALELTSKDSPPPYVAI